MESQRSHQSETVDLVSSQTFCYVLNGHFHHANSIHQTNKKLSIKRDKHNQKNEQITRNGRVGCLFHFNNLFGISPSCHLPGQSWQILLEMSQQNSDSDNMQELLPFVPPLLHRQRYRTMDVSSLCEIEWN